MSLEFESKYSEDRLLTEGELLLAARSGDNDAFAALWVLTEPQLVAFLRRRYPSQDADDIASQAFSRVFESMRSGGGPETNFRAYLYSTARNCALTEIRRNSAYLEPFDDEFAPTAEDVYRSTDRVIHVESVMKSLPKQWSLVLKRIYIDGEALESVSLDLGISKGALAALTKRARSAMRIGWINSHAETGLLPGPCQLAMLQVGEVIEGKLSGKAARAAAEHLEGCPDCRRRISQVERRSRRFAGTLMPATVGTAAMTTVPGAGGLAAGSSPSSSLHLSARGSADYLAGAGNRMIPLMTGATVTAAAVAITIGFVLNPNDAADNTVPTVVEAVEGTDFTSPPSELTFEAVYAPASPGQTTPTHSAFTAAYATAGTGSTIPIPVTSEIQTTRTPSSGARTSKNTVTPKPTPKENLTTAAPTRTTSPVIAPSRPATAAPTGPTWLPTHTSFSPFE